LLAASEVVGFAKTGGLADVAGSLPPALARLGHQCAVILPLYRCTLKAANPPKPTDLTFTVPIGDKTVPGRLWRSTLPNTEIPVYLVEQKDYFDRDDPQYKRGLYQFLKTDGRLGDYPDNFARFTFFCRAVLEALRLLDYWPDVLHANDWQTGLLPVFLREDYARHPHLGLREKYGRVRTLFTIHNIAYQGIFWHWDMDTARLDWRLFNKSQLEFHGHLNCLKAGLVFADLLNTVSPTYAREIQTPYYGYGLQGVLSERRHRLFGIVNGVDYRVWDPATDPLLPAHFSVDAIGPGKPQCKAALQKECGLPAEPKAPLLGVVARLVEQKGVELIGQAAPRLLDDGAQLIVLGEGDPRYHQLLSAVRDRYPQRVSLTFGFDEGFAHRIEAGVDLFLMPSLYEPSGLNQLYSMRYGTPPVVRATGGLADTVVDTTLGTLANGTATGFSFQAFTGDALFEAAERGIALYRGQTDTWRQVLATAMRADWSWDRSAAEYERLYQLLRDEQPRKDEG
jgi:starch synthase